MTRRAAAREAPVLEVVDGLEQADGDRRLQQVDGERAEPRARPGSRARRAHSTTRPCSTRLAQHARDRPAHVLVAEPLALEPPGAAELGRTVRRKNRGGLAEARRRGVLAACRRARGGRGRARCRSARRARCRAAARPSGCRCALGTVDELVRDDDARVAGVHADEQHAHERVEGPEPVRRAPGDQERDDRELSARARTGPQSNGQPGRVGSRLAPLAGAPHVGPHRSHHHQEPGGRPPARPGTGEQKREAGHRQHEAQEMSRPHPCAVAPGQDGVDGGGARHRCRSHTAWYVNVHGLHTNAYVVKRPGPGQAGHPRGADPRRAPGVRGGRPRRPQPGCDLRPRRIHARRLLRPLQGPGRLPGRGDGVRPGRITSMP